MRDMRAVWVSSLLGLVWLVVASSTVNASGLPDFTELVKDNADAVVNISTTGRVEDRRGSRGREDFEQLPDLFRHFFGGPGAPDRSPRQRESRSMGSGFIVSSDGYILTNHHVVENADEIIVRLMDRRELEATVVGTDPRTDMAVLKVDASDLPVAKVGRSDDLQVGEWVFAIGSPFGFDYTVTAGIVSAKGRSLPRESYVPFIQTDVAINPGNSGGPLFNMNGEVVGINSQIYTRSGGFMGVSFAIPMDMAMDVFEQIRDQGSVSRGWLGVLIQEVSRDLAETFGLDRPYGALVAQVMSDSPAEAAGIQPGDVILSFNEEEISTSSELPPKVGRSRVGDEASVTLMRDGEELTLSVTIRQLPEDDDPVQASEPREPEQGSLLGLVVEPVPDSVLAEWDLDGGLLVREVRDGPAREAGLRRNDVIRSINNQAVMSVEDFQQVVSELEPGRSVPVLIVRNGSPSFLVIRTPRE